MLWNGESRIKKKIEEIKKSLRLRLYDCALSLTLTLPSICARVEYGKGKTSDKRNYINWFDKYAKDKFAFKSDRIPDGEIVEFNTIDGKTCYSLRCAVLHAGNFKVNDCKYTKIEIHGHKQNSEIFEHEFTEADILETNIPSEEIVYGTKFHMDVTKFCNLLCLAAEEYYDLYDDKTKFTVEDVVVLNW